jgi:hypothetical protein
MLLRGWLSPTFPCISMEATVDGWDGPPTLRPLLKCSARSSGTPVALRNFEVWPSTLPTTTPGPSALALHTPHPIQTVMSRDMSMHSPLSWRTLVSLPTSLWILVNKHPKSHSLQTMTNDLCRPKWCSAHRANRARKLVQRNRHWIRCSANHKHWQLAG